MIRRMVGRPARERCHAAAYDPNTFRYCDQSELGITVSARFQVRGQSSAAARRADRRRASELCRVAARGELGGAYEPVSRRTDAGRHGEPRASGRTYLHRWNQLDLSVRRVFTFGKVRLDGALEIFNSLN